MTLPPNAGVGLKPEHYRAVLDGTPAVGWVEVHPENYMGAGGAPHHYLTRVRERLALSLHGVGLSIGAAAPLDGGHLDRLAALVSRYEPASVSEHLAWSTHDGAYLNDLLPLPYDDATLALVGRHVSQMQDRLGRRVLIENPSTYVAFTTSRLEEIEFLTALARQSGCGLLLDVNNVQVSCTNHGWDPLAYIDSFPVELAGEIHLAGHARFEDEAGQPLLIDSHDRQVAPDVWQLYARVLRRAGARPTLIEWDSDLPPWTVLEAEARQADALLAAHARQAAEGRADAA